MLCTTDSWQAKLVLLMCASSRAYQSEHRRLPCRLVKEPLGQGWGVLQ